MTRHVSLFILIVVLCQPQELFGNIAHNPAEVEANPATQPRANELIKVGTNIVVDMPVDMGSAVDIPLDTVIVSDTPIEVVNGFPRVKQKFPDHPVVPLDQATGIVKEIIKQLLAEGPPQGDASTHGEVGIREATHDIPPLPGTTGDFSFQPSAQQVHDFPAIISEVPMLNMPNMHTIPPDIPLLKLQHEFPLLPLHPEFPLPPPMLPEFLLASLQHEFPLTPLKTEFPLAPLKPEFPLAPLQPKFPLAPLKHEFPLAPLKVEFPLAPLQPKFPLPPLKPEFPLPPLKPEFPLPPLKPEFPLPPLKPEFPLPPLKHGIPLPPLPPTIKIPFQPITKIHSQAKKTMSIEPTPSKPIILNTNIPPSVKQDIHWQVKIRGGVGPTTLPMKKGLPVKRTPPKPKQQSIIKKSAIVHSVKQAIQTIPKEAVPNKKTLPTAKVISGKSQKTFVAVQSTLSTLDRLRSSIPTSTDPSILLTGHPQFTGAKRSGNKAWPARPLVDFLGQRKDSVSQSGFGSLTHTSKKLQHGFGSKHNVFNLDLSKKAVPTFMGNTQQQNQSTIVNPLTVKDMADYGTFQSGKTEQNMQPVAERVLQDMDLTINPCENFYKFACGGYIKNSVNTNGILAKSNEAAYNVLGVVKAALEEPTTSKEPGPLTKAKVLYNSCMNEDAIEASAFTEIYDFISELGGWPVLGNWDDFNFDFVELLAKPRQYIKDYGFHYQPTGVIIGTVIQPDYKAPDRYGLYIDQPSLGLTGFGGLPTRELYLVGNNNVYIEAYKQYATDIAVALGANPETARREMNDLVDFEICLAKIMLCEEERRLAEVRYQKLSIIELTMLYPRFEWLRYLQTIVKQSNAGISVNPTDPVILWAKPYYDRLFHLLKTVQHRTLANYVVWRAIQPLLPAMNRQIRQSTALYVSIVNGAEQVAMPPRNDFCVNVVITNMRWVASRVYVDRAFGPDALTKVLEIAEYVKQAHIQQIQRSEWLDGLTKSELLVKLRTLTDDIGFPQYLMSNTYLDDFYHDHHFTLDNFFENMKRALTRNYARQLQQLAYPQLDRWILSPVEVNALLNLGTGEIELPAAIIQEPFFSLDYPLSMNVGGIGWLIGHEYGHGFDVTGAKFDGNGMINKVWSDSSFQNFARRADCFLRQFSDYYLPEGNLRIRNGNKTLNENLCDFIGHKTAFHAYQQIKAEGRLELNDHVVPQFSGDQLYFINTARMYCSNMSPTFLRKIPYLTHHSVDRIRVIGALQNLPEFSSTFSCPTGSPMNPREKCDFW